MAKIKHPSGGYGRKHDLSPGKDRGADSSSRQKPEYIKSIYGLARNGTAYFWNYDPGLWLAPEPLGGVNLSARSMCAVE
jgi:hypothetical protein